MLSLIKSRKKGTEELILKMMQTKQERFKHLENHPSGCRMEYICFSASNRPYKDLSFLEDIEANPFAKNTCEIPLAQREKLEELKDADLISGFSACVRSSITLYLIEMFKKIDPEQEEKAMLEGSNMTNPLSLLSYLLEKGLIGSKAEFIRLALFSFLSDKLTALNEKLRDSKNHTKGVNKVFEVIKTLDTDPNSHLESHTKEIKTKYFLFRDWRYNKIVSLLADKEEHLSIRRISQALNWGYRKTSSVLLNLRKKAPRLLKCGKKGDHGTTYYYLSKKVLKTLIEYRELEDVKHEEFNTPAEFLNSILESEA